MGWTTAKHTVKTRVYMTISEKNYIHEAMNTTGGQNIASNRTIPCYSKWMGESSLLLLIFFFEFRSIFPEDDGSESRWPLAIGWCADICHFCLFPGHFSFPWSKSHGKQDSSHIQFTAQTWCWHCLLWFRQEGCIIVQFKGSALTVLLCALP